MSKQIKKTKVINLFSGSGTGKSTLAMRLTSELKLRGIHAEYVPEYMKNLAWEERFPQKFDQISIFGQQAKQESLLYEKVDFIFTDSPLLLVPFYEEFLTDQKIVEPAAFNFIKYAEKHGVSYHNFWLERIDTFDTNGRFESQEEAIKVDKALRKWLDKHNVDLINVPKDHEERMRIILTHLKQEYKK